MTEDSRGLPELFDIFRWRWKLMALIALAVTAGAVLYAESLPAEYDGVAIVSIEPDLEVPISADYVRIGAPKYVSYLTAPATIRNLAPELDEDPEELEHAVDATVAADSGNVTITARLPSPEQAAEVANAFAVEAVAYSEEDELLNAEIVARALPDLVPAAPPRRLLEAAGLGAGLILALAAAALVERGHPRARTWRDIALVAGYPILQRIPATRAARAAPETALADPVVGSAIRTLTTNLDRTIPGPGRAILVTSPAGGQGKTTIATLVAAGLARLGRRVLLVDANLRRPRISRGASLAAGLSDVLRGKATVDAAIRPGSVEGLSLLTTSADAEAADLLARRLPDVLSHARKRFDVVLLDGPSILGAGDAPVIATAVDGILVVVSGGAPVDQISEAVVVLHSVDVPVVGVVANRLSDGAGAE